MLRADGLPTEEAKLVSVVLFEEAKYKLMLKQVPQLVLSWVMISIGVVAFVYLQVFSGMTSKFFTSLLFGGLPVMIGAFMLTRRQNPQRVF